jgi:hypothetical protein
VEISSATYEAHSVNKWMEKVTDEMSLSTQKLLETFFERKRAGWMSQQTYVSAAVTYTKATGKPLSEDTQNDLEEWYRYMEREGFYASTTYSYATRLKKLLEYTKRLEGLKKGEARTVAEELFENVPMKELASEAKKNNELRNKLVTPEEFNKMLNTAGHPGLEKYDFSAGNLV